MRQDRGFTLLEFIIAFALIVVILSSVYITQGTRLSSSLRSKNVLIATNLAKNHMAEEELKLEGLPFDRVDAKSEGKFEQPYDKFKWKQEVEKIDFSALTDVLVSKMGDKEKEQNSMETEMVVKYFKDYLEKSVRRLTLTIEWEEGSGSTSMSFTELLVNYDADFASGV